MNQSDIDIEWYCIYRYRSRYCVQGHTSVKPSYIDSSYRQWALFCFTHLHMYDTARVLLFLAPLLRLSESNQSIECAVQQRKTRSRRTKMTAPSSIVRIVRILRKPNHFGSNNPLQYGKQCIAKTIDRGHESTEL
jgi:hypothetical protein